MNPHHCPRVLETLFAAHALPDTWSVVDCYQDATEVAGLRVEVVGLVARSSDGREVLGSAGEQGAPPFERAYFELIERIAIMDASGTSGPACGASPAQAGCCFPDEPEGATFRYSRSNGVAAGRDWESACQSARAELVERDRILRSWYGAIRPRPLLLPDDAALQTLAASYEFSAFSFPELEPRLADDLHVVALFGLPRRRGVPLIFGSGAGSSQVQAWRRASRECLQRWAFLWGEPIPDAEPEFSATPEYHQELFLWPGMHARLIDWLRGEHVTSNGSIACLKGHGDVLFSRLPTRPNSGVCVARATSEAALPLVFGRGHPLVHELPLTLAVHPLV